MAIVKPEAKEVERLDEDIAYGNLAEAIILQAVSDWRRLCSMILKEKTGNPVIAESPEVVSFPELRRFFKSEWFDCMCGKSDPAFVLNGLELERESAINEIEGMEVKHELNALEEAN